MIDTYELVVPKSIPMISLPIEFELMALISLSHLYVKGTLGPDD